MQVIKPELARNATGKGYPLGTVQATGFHLTEVYAETRIFQETERQMKQPGTLIFKQITQSQHPPQYCNFSDTITWMCSIPFHLSRPVDHFRSILLDGLKQQRQSII